MSCLHGPESNILVSIASQKCPTGIDGAKLSSLQLLNTVSIPVSRVSSGRQTYSEILSNFMSTPRALLAAVASSSPAASMGPNHLSVSAI